MFEKSIASGSCPAFVLEESEPLTEAINYDVIVCGGTLGIFVACALQLKGLKVRYDLNDSVLLHCTFLAWK